MPGLPARVELAPQRRRPRFYVLRVLACERDFTPTEFSVTSGPYPSLADAWTAAGIFRLLAEGQVFIAGEQ
jgi:hypothetical protein